MSVSHKRYCYIRMVKEKLYISLSLFLILMAWSSPSGDAWTWDIDNLERIGGYPVTVFGDPMVVQTDLGKAVRFDGDGDRLLVDHNPIGEAKSFTVEVVFKPDACYPHNTDPRFIHIQDPDDKQEKRLLIELRVNEQNECYLDAFIKTDTSALVLIDENLVHPTDEWLHAAVVFDNGVMTTYINGIRELSGKVGYVQMLINPGGKVSIGGRMDHRNWFSGLIRTLKVTPLALDPGDFIRIPQDVSMK